MKQSTLGLCPGGCCGGAPMALASPWAAFSTGGLSEKALILIRPRSIVRVTPAPPNLTIDRTIFEMWLVLADPPKSVAARS